METILCAAIWYQTEDKYEHQPVNVEKGLVYCGYRHCSILQQIKDLPRPDLKSQGFLTNKNRFVDRYEGAAIAFKAGQTPTQFTRLFSEDLYTQVPD